MSLRLGYHDPDWQTSTLPNLILAALYKQMQSPDVTAMLNKGLEEMGVTVKGVSVKGLDDQSKKKVEEVKDRLKGLLGD